MVSGVITAFGVSGPPLMFYWTRILFCFSCLILDFLYNIDILGRRLDSTVILL